MRTNISWAFAGNAVYAGCQWTVFVLLVHSLQLSDVGRFAYGIAVTGPVFVLANMRLRNLVATGVSSPHGFSDYLAARLLTSAVAVGVSLLMGAALSSDPATVAVVALIASGKACEAISDICHGLFQRELDMRSAAIGLLINGFLSVALVALSLVVWPSLALATGAYAVASLLALLAWDLPRMRRLTAAWAPGITPSGTLIAVRALIGRALPLGLSSALGSLQINLPRYVIAAYLGPAALAVFTALAYLTTLGNLIANAVAQSALPVLARDLHGSPARFRRRLWQLVLSGTALGALGLAATAVAGRPLLTLIYGPDYAEHAGVLLWLMAAAAVTYTFVFLGTATTARRRFGAQFATSCVGLVTVGCSVVPLVGRYGLRGAAGALVAGALVEASIYTSLTLHDLKADARHDAAASAAAAEQVQLVKCHG